MHYNSLSYEITTARPPSALPHLGGLALKQAGIVFANQYPTVMARAEQRNHAVINEATRHQKTNVLQTPPQPSTLLHRLEAGAAGDPEALDILEIDAYTELIEQVCKAGGILKVEANISDNNEIQQYGLTTQQRQANTLQAYKLADADLRTIVHTEGQNAFSIEELYREGLLEGHRALEISLIPVAAHKVLAEHGYYLREVIGIARVTSINKATGKCEIVSMLFGGTDQDTLPAVETLTTEAAEIAVEQQALENRYDIAAVRQLHAELGTPNAHALTVNELLSRIALIPTKFDHLDVMMLLDQLISGLHADGRHFFMGLTNLRTTDQPPTRQDYEAHERQSLAFQAQLKPLAKKVRQTVIERRKQATNHVEASHLFRQIAKDEAVEYLVTDRTADTRVFGVQTYHAIAQARQRLDVGDWHGAQQFIGQAKEVAKPTGCPQEQQKTQGLLKSLANKLLDKLLNRNGEESDEQDTTTGTLRCINCRETVQKKEVIKEDCWECPRCKHKVDICSGKILQQGQTKQPNVNTAANTPNSFSDLLAAAIARKPQQNKTAAKTVY